MELTSVFDGTGPAARQNVDRITSASSMRLYRFLVDQSLANSCPIYINKYK